MELAKEKPEPLRWIQMERLSPRKTRSNRSSHTGKALDYVLNYGLMEKLQIDGKTRYGITKAGMDHLAWKNASTVLAASAPFYFRRNKTELVCFGAHVDEIDKAKLVEIFQKYPKLRAVNRDYGRLIDLDPV